MSTLDAHRIAAKLYIGGAPQADALRTDGRFQVVVLCATDYQPKTLPGVKLLRAPFNDIRELDEQAQKIVLSAARAVHKLRRGGARVLVTCVAGVNRSSLVTAVALMLDGRTAQQAIDLIRETRKPPVGMTPLSNNVFEQWLRFELQPKIASARKKLR